MLSAKVIPQAIATKTLGDLLARVRLNSETFVISRFGKQVAVLAPLHDAAPEAASEPVPAAPEGTVR